VRWRSHHEEVAGDGAEEAPSAAVIEAEEEAVAVEEVVSAIEEVLVDEEVRRLPLFNFLWLFAKQRNHLLTGD
jgi:hypothetical protein